MSSSDNRTVKVIEVIGESSESWQDAAENAVADAAKTLDGVSGVEVQDHTAQVEDGEIVQYRTVVHVAFPIQR